VVFIGFLIVFIGFSWFSRELVVLKGYFGVFWWPTARRGAPRGGWPMSLVRIFSSIVIIITVSMHSKLIILS